MNNKKEVWYYSFIKRFADENYSSLITENHLKELRSFKLKKDVDIKGKPIFGDITGWLININKKQYVLPQEIGGKDLRDMLPVKIVNEEQFTYKTQIYHKPKSIQGVKIFKIPAEKTMTYDEWFDGFANFEHSNPLHFKLYKMLVLGSLLFRINYRVCTQPSFGKDSIPSILSDLIPMDISVYTPKSAPKLMTMLEKRLLIIDEIVDVDKSSMDILEPVIRVAGDLRNKVNNGSLAVSSLTKDNYDISNLSIGFIYNELKDYMPPNLKTDKSDKYFDNSFTNATKQRFMPFMFTGELDTNQFKGQISDEYYKDNVTYLKNWIKMYKWLTNGGYKELLAVKKEWKWELNKEIGSKGGRLNYHFNSILDCIKLSCVNETEFNHYANEMYKCYINYLKMIDVNNEHFTTNIHNEEKI